MAVTMSMAGHSTHCRRGGFAVRWLLALHIRLVEQGKLAAAVALQLPSRILKAAVKDTTALAPRQALFFVLAKNSKIGSRSRSSKSGGSRIRSRNKISRRERSESRERFVSEISRKHPPEQQSSKPKPLNALKIQANFSSH